MKGLLDHKKLVVLAMLRGANKPISHTELVVACALNPDGNLFGAVLDLESMGFIDKTQTYEDSRKENKTYYKLNERGMDCFDEISTIEPKFRFLYSNMGFKTRQISCHNNN